MSEEALQAAAVRARKIEELHEMIATLTAELEDLERDPPRTFEMLAAPSEALRAEVQEPGTRPAPAASGTATAHAVVALGQSGIGIYASGEQAPIQLGRAQTAGPPATGFHSAGEIFLDANADLHLCKVDGTPGTWTLVA